VIDAGYITGHSLDVFTHDFSRALNWAFTFQITHYRDSLYLIELPANLPREKFISNNESYLQKNEVYNFPLGYIC
jgi:hypothetical protein